MFTGPGDSHENASGGPTILPTTLDRVSVVTPVFLVRKLRPGRV